MWTSPQTSVVGFPKILLQTTFEKLLYGNYIQTENKPFEDNYVCSTSCRILQRRVRLVFNLRWQLSSFLWIMLLNTKNYALLHVTCQKTWLKKSFKIFFRTFCKYMINVIRLIMSCL